MMGTPGYMAFESMSREPVAGAAGQDVVGVAMVLLMVCLRKELRSPNLYANMVRGGAWVQQCRVNAFTFSDRCLPQILRAQHRSLSCCVPSSELSLCT